MRPFFLIMGLLLVGLLGFIGYCWLLIDCCQDLKLGIYDRYTLLKAVILLIYSYAGFCFIDARLPDDHPFEP